MKQWPKFVGGNLTPQHEKQLRKIIFNTENFCGNSYQAAMEYMQENDLKNLQHHVEMVHLDEVKKFYDDEGNRK